MPKLTRSTSMQTFNIINNNNVSYAHDSGYTSNKHMVVSSKSVPYTEDRNISFGNDKYYIIGAADGHGGSPKMSILASGSFPVYFHEHFYRTYGDIELSLLHTFKDIDKLSHIKGDNSGTTLNVCVIDILFKKAYIANLGDSVTQIFRKNAETNNYESIFRTVDHDASNVEEQLRIKRQFRDVEFSLDDSEIMYAKYNKQKTMVTGGFGDFGLPPGFMKRIPDIDIVDIQENDIIICSTDGYYETFNSKTKKLGPGRNEKEILNDLNILHPSILAIDLMEEHVKHILDIDAESFGRYTRKALYKNIKENRDNNFITTYTVK